MIQMPAVMPAVVDDAVLNRLQDVAESPGRGQSRAGQRAGASQADANLGVLAQA
jgi:hypothetical protein